MPAPGEQASPPYVGCSILRRQFLELGQREGRAVFADVDLPDVAVAALAEAALYAVPSTVQNYLPPSWKSWDWLSLRTCCDIARGRLG
jgi:hypothetical protein